MNKKQYLAIISVVILLAGGLYYFLKEEPLVSPPPAKETVSDPLAELSYIGNKIIEEKDGHRQWELTADSIAIDPNTKMLRLTNLKAIVYQDNGGTVNITAPMGTMDTKTKDITLEGNVKAIASDGATFSSQQARWQGKERRFFGTGGVIVTREDTVLTGDQMESDGNIEKVKVQGNAHVYKGGEFK